ncbi:uncharacterized protein LOC9649526 [Selaginella moellendorffii]|uniref:uncharacterized protein LOC9649526 n=1 Tax=Selaginella moellendorffii TaxID=88036 RepID=UPI000D1CF8B3|nr:uncharacterized protein LOC9649526 [Selaginella moellendorffii]|eukprot:XP_024537390.1 uncharacterized protein LOC9649526 [Selaginella moellendorffii]
MEELYRDILSFGCLRVFRHFTTYLRGREELLITIRSEESISSGRNFCLENRSSKSALPPASPSSSETKKVKSNETLFLLGAYGRYAWPYIWLRSDTEGCNHEFNKDRPVDLQTLRDWKIKGTKVWDIVEELISLKAPGVVNPFEVDFAALNKLQPLERATMAGATAAFLQKLLLEREQDYTQHVMDDLKRLLVCHFQHMATLLPGT